MGFRFFLLNLFFLAVYFALGFNLYQLQVEQNDYYFKKVKARTEYQKELQLRRGKIFFTDRNGNFIPAAINKDYPVIYAVPKEISNPQETALLLVNALKLKISVDELKEKLSNKKSLFYLVVDKATNEELETVKTLNIKGVYVGEKQHRFYPFENIAAHLLGFVGLNASVDKPTGLYGAELYFNDRLSKGENVYLTIDRILQAEAEQTLSELIEKYDASGGSVIIQEPFSGKILAMVSNPDFDPNDYSKYPVSNFINPAVQYIYEPGSVFKPITMAAGIDLGVITPETTYIDKGSVILNGKIIKNWDHKSYGIITMTRVIEKSINTGAVFVEQQIGHNNFLKYLKKFGFGSHTGIDLPNEVPSNLDDLENNARDIDYATASFGQGIAVTPIQLINAYSAIANGGVLMRPYINLNDSPYVIRRVIDKHSAELVIGMMESAVEKAKVASIAGYRVAGKTGTAQIPDFVKGGYSDEYIHTFVGFAPASKPRFVILLKLDKPFVSLAGSTVVPAFRDLARFVLNYYNVLPDNLQN